MRGKATATLKDLKVLRLSNIDPRLGFFVEIMNAMKTKAEAGDMLSFHKGVISAAMDREIINLKSVKFVGLTVSLAGKGDFTLKDKRLRLHSTISTPFGTRKDFTVDSILSKEKKQS